MIDSSRSTTAAQSPLAGTALGLLLCAIALITLALGLAEDLGTPAFLALIGAELALTACMGTLFGTVRAQRTADTEQQQRDEAALDALEPLREGGQR
ncbi:hypothetical protein [Streptomyces sp. XH2]|uniref:hypothetical protein n=1 Tax=Streptomyces sp. XH2 TaxID=3412483 RepID=UPI003C7C90CF